jgi:hypothetical protein
VGKGEKKCSRMKIDVEKGGKNCSGTKFDIGSERGNCSDTKVDLKKVAKLFRQGKQHLESKEK